MQPVELMKRLISENAWEMERKCTGACKEYFLEQFFTFVLTAKLNDDRKSALGIE